MIDNSRINWFPGHMNKTLKEMQRDSKLCDFFIYVLDARCPKSCINPEFVKVVKGKPIVYVLNKADLVAEADIKKFINYFKNEGASCVALNAVKTGSSKIILNELNEIFSAVFKENQKRGVNFIKRGMVLGVPNSGKSTIVNNLCNKARAQTGNRAGVTKSKQWVKVLAGFEFLDTPGVLLPNFEDENVAYNLAIVGSIKDEVLNLIDIAGSLIKKLQQIDKSILSTKYGVSFEYNTPYLDILTIIGKKRGCLKKGGEIDLERTSKLLLTDFRNGKLGRICLEKI